MTDHVQPTTPPRQPPRLARWRQSDLWWSFTHKPSAIIGTSPGAIGTAVAQQQLRSVLAFCNSPLMNAVEAYIQFKPGLVADDGNVTDESTAKFLRHYPRPTESGF